jgi:hypothetical protein
MTVTTNAPHFNRSVHTTRPFLIHEGKKVTLSLCTPQSYVWEWRPFSTSTLEKSEEEVRFTPRPHYSRSSPNKRLPVLKIQFNIILPSTVKSLKGYLLTRVAFILFDPFNNFTCNASSSFLGQNAASRDWTNRPSRGRQDFMKSCRRESLKTCTTSLTLISIPSKNNNLKVQTYFYVTISSLVNSYILGTLFNTFPINVRNHNPWQCEPMGKTAISYHRHVPSEC